MMNAEVGDSVLIHGRTVGAATRHGQVVGIRGSAENPLLVVRYDDGHEAVLSPGSDCEITHTG